ncbi:arsenate reductase-like glutaredoxin family protein [Chryseobacterium sp. 16F]|uniref:Arsenate reductase-like glutaredoxin family protein n=2 Tax=Frigoriflavimonas asaccharolytica TaxID=2735899 RepID=A0A8J8G8F9_9FLAO|nr:arsenate reductase-like glutaredoxin family protein [Frigoriflavimonas asaccharolytica]
MSEFDLSNWKLREIKTQPILDDELAAMHSFTNSYEDLFSKRSTQIKAENLDVKSFKEEDFKNLILKHYSFLKRPVFLTDKEIFVGNAKENIENLREFFRVR